VSLLSPDHLGVALYPDRLLLARTSGLLRRRLKHKQIIAVAPADEGAPLWQPAVDALASQVAAGAMAGAAVTLVLSNRFVNYALVPYSDALGSAEEELAFVRHCFSRVHGSEADRWAFRLSQGSPGKSRLACGVEQTLIDALAKVMTPLGSHYRSLQPHLMASFNRWRTRLAKRPGWFVVAEPGLLSLAMLCDGQWHSVRTLKVGPDWPQELPGVLSREEFMVGSHTPCDDVMLFAPDAAQPLMLEPGKWRINTLLPTLLPGMAAGVDTPFSIALGA
jgi:hypothetical protein